MFWPGNPPKFLEENVWQKQSLILNNLFPISFYKIIPNLRWIYCTTSSVKPCLDMVVNTSVAPLRHWILCVGHQLLMALKSKFRSSSLASSSAEAAYWHNRFKSCQSNKTRIKYIFHSLYGKSYVKGFQFFFFIAEHILFFYYLKWRKIQTSNFFDPMWAKLNLSHMRAILNQSHMRAAFTLRNHPTSITTVSFLLTDTTAPNPQPLPLFIFLPIHSVLSLPLTWIMTLWSSFCFDIISSTISLLGPSISGRSKNKYRHLTKVEGRAAMVIGWTILCPPLASKFNVDSNIQPLLFSSLSCTSKYLIIAHAASSV